MGWEQEGAVHVKNVVKKYGAITALYNISLNVEAGEFFTLLGPSGCGKTTLLRTIAGFEDLTSGEIFLQGVPISSLPANKREVNTVFQHYALFPLMSVIENVEFGLLRKGSNRSEARKRASEILEMVHMGDFHDRFPAQLSGGQQQRVALARALAPSPKVLLLDEPLSALDLKLRQKVRIELKSLQRDTGITFIFVTHDQEEALTMSDRIAVMSDGKLLQIGSPKDIYERPANRFVANFIGETNLFEVQIEDGFALLPGNQRVSIDKLDSNITSGTLSIRPENLILTDDKQGQIVGRVTENVYIGTNIQLLIDTESGQQVTARVHNSDAAGLPSIGDIAHFRVEEGRARLLTN